MAKPPVEKGKAAPLIPALEEPSRDKIRLACDDAASILRQKNRQDELAIPVNRILPSVERPGHSRIARGQRPKIAGDAPGMSELSPRLKELIELCYAIAQGKQTDPPEGRGTSPASRQIPPRPVADLIGALLDDIRELKTAPPRVRMILRCRMIEGMHADEISGVLPGTPLSEITNSINESINFLRSTIGNYYDLTDIVGYYFDIHGNNASGFYRLPPTEPTPSAPASPAENRQQLIAALLETVSADESYETQASELESLNKNVADQLTERIAAAIKAKLRNSTADTYSEKLAVTHWVNAELKRFDLTISSHVTNGPATLTADAAGRGGVGRFQLKRKTKDEDGKYKYFTTQNISELVSNIDIVQASRREALSEWRQRITEQPSETSRA